MTETKSPFGELQQLVPQLPESVKQDIGDRVAD